MEGATRHATLQTCQGKTSRAWKICSFVEVLFLLWATLTPCVTYTWGHLMHSLNACIVTKTDNNGKWTGSPSHWQVLARHPVLEKHLHRSLPFTNISCTPAVSGGVENTGVYDTIKEFLVHYAGVFMPLGSLMSSPLTSEFLVQRRAGSCIVPGGKKKGCPTTST